MGIPQNLPKILLGAAFGVLLAIAVLVFIRMDAYEDEISALRSQVASRDRTIEVQKRVYHKLTIESTDLRSLLSSKDEEIVKLKTELDKNREEVLTISSLVLKWKKAYEAAAEANQVEVPTDSGVVRKKVTFSKDFGMIGVNGWTLTDPAEAWVRVEQLRPLKLSVFVSQDKAGVWHTRTTSSEENVGVDIALAGVNPYVLSPKWYEGIGVSFDLGGGSNKAGFGIIAGAGLKYRVGQFDLGPSTWVTVSDRIDSYFGGSLVWHAFQKR